MRRSIPGSNYYGIQNKIHGHANIYFGIILQPRDIFEWGYQYQIESDIYWHRSFEDLNAIRDDSYSSHACWLFFISPEIDRLPKVNIALPRGIA